MDVETKNFSQLQWARILVKNRGNFFPGTMHLVVDSYCYALQLWWERLPWISVVVPMKILKGGEGDKAREEWDVGSCAGSGSSKGKERWRVVEADGAGSIRKAGGEEKYDGDSMTDTTEEFSAFEKKAGGKGSEGVRLSEGYARLERCKPIYGVAQAQLDRALKDMETFCGPRVC